MVFVASQDKESFAELVISLTQLLIVQDEESQDDYRDNYVRSHAGPIRLVNAESEEEIEIGEIELFYFDGTRALDNDLDIVDVCDSVGQDQYDTRRRSTATVPWIPRLSVTGFSTTYWHFTRFQFCQNIEAVSMVYE
jgi:hypothetical protein